MKTKTYEWKKTKRPGFSALRRIRRLFPKVLTVSDSTKRVSVIVTEADSQGGKPGEFKACALARACHRELHMDGAIIGLSTSYLIKGTHATRFTTPEAIQREMVSYDRHKDFDPGRYTLNAIGPAKRLGRHTNRPTIGNGKKRRNLDVAVHVTSRVRRMGHGNRWGATQ